MDSSMASECLAQSCCLLVCLQLAQVMSLLSEGCCSETTRMASLVLFFFFFYNESVSWSDEDINIRDSQSQDSNESLAGLV